MRSKQLAAIELLMSRPDSEAAAELKIRLTTLRRWMREPDFSGALKTRVQQQRASSSRMVRQVVVNAAWLLCRILSDPAKCDPKILLEVLKAAGSFDAEPEESCVSLADIMRDAVNSVLEDDNDKERM